MNVMAIAEKGINQGVSQSQRVNMYRKAIKLVEPRGRVRLRLGEIQFNSMMKARARGEG